MPNEFPYFPFYVDDFAADGKVEAMTTLEVGSYILLLCKAWKEQPRGTLPDDEAVLARWSRLSPTQWSEVAPRVLACFRLSTDGRWHQKRMELEARKLLDLTNKRSKNGKLAAEARWQHANALQSQCERIADALPTQCDSMPRASESSSVFVEGEIELEKAQNKDPPKKKKKGGAGGELPEGFAEFWVAYPDHSAKPRAVTAWRKINPDAALRAVMLAALEKHKQSERWSKGFIPYLATWLNDRRWEDVPAPPPKGNGNGQTRADERTAYRFPDADFGSDGPPPQ